MLSQEDNELITRIGNGSPLTQMLRRYWVPAMLSTELPEPGCAPVPVRLLGEELVAWRMSDGSVGLLAEHCSHRGTSLVYARTEGDCLRCIYHGWLYDAGGNVLETPAEPERSVIGTKIQHPAYATHEAAGVIWAYLGPRERQPLFPTYDYALAPPENVYVTKVLLECNWLQGLEGECDSAHVGVLHERYTEAYKGSPIAQDAVPAYEIEESDFGVRLIATRTQWDESQHYVRVSSFVMPCGVWVPVANREIHFYVPIDDRRCWRFDMGYLTQPVRPENVNRAPHIGPDFRRYDDRNNGYGQVRAMMDPSDPKGNFSGIASILVQDACVTETMDYSGMFDRTKERLGVSDIAIIAVRNFLLKAVKAFQDGAEPPHLVRDPAQNVMTHIDTVQAVFPKTESWREHWPYLTPSYAGIERPAEAAAHAPEGGPRGS